MSENGFEETVNHFPNRTLLYGTIVRKSPAMSDPSGKPRLPRGAVRCGRCRVGRTHRRRLPPAACSSRGLSLKSISPAGAVTEAKIGNRCWPKGEQACGGAAGTSGGRIVPEKEAADRSRGTDRPGWERVVGPREDRGTRIAVWIRPLPPVRPRAVKTRYRENPCDPWKRS